MLLKLTKQIIVQQQHKKNVFIFNNKIFFQYCLNISIVFLKPELNHITNTLKVTQSSLNLHNHVF